VFLDPTGTAVIDHHDQGTSGRTRWLFHGYHRISGCRRPCGATTVDGGVVTDHPDHWSALPNVTCTVLLAPAGSR
ncbi:MAG: hypothetical protein QG655_1883, partial [Actinomycetota bacterium]|nr:hypothetical protein [Actinomycetota bacterium]